MVRCGSLPAFSRIDGLATMPAVGHIGSSIFVCRKQLRTPEVAQWARPSLSLSLVLV